MAANQETSKTTAAPQRPTITLPPKPSIDSFISGGFVGLSPGPMTLVSSFFASDTPTTNTFNMNINSFLDSSPASFSQLLAGAMASPIARPNLFSETSLPNTSNTTTTTTTTNNNNNSNNTTSSGDLASRDGVVKDGDLGYKQSRPVNLVVARSPLFTVPPGLSPSGLLNSPGFFPPQSPFGMSHQQALAQVTAQAAIAAQSQMHLQAHYQPSSVGVAADFLSHQPSFTTPEVLQQHIPPSTSDNQSSLVEPSGLTHSERKYQPPLAVDKPGDDGYNWRKYGQKPIKGCEFPRSYYKCTHPSCPVKKKVERSSEGQITEIIYRGQHNHERPQANKRSKDCSDPNGTINSQIKSDFDSLSHVGDTSKVNDSVLSISIRGRDQESSQVEPSELSESSDSEEVGNAAAREEEDDEPNPKRRQTDTAPAEVALQHKTVTEPKIIVQTRSEVDLLDDGYRWRKYGQKVVKGNPHPRSYYKCTSAGCNVRKHVERAAADPKSVITTYEGKHNHDVPSGRNSSHNTVNNSNTTQSKLDKGMDEKQRPPHRGTEFSNSSQQPVLLRLKEEKFAV